MTSRLYFDRTAALLFVFLTLCVCARPASAIEPVDTQTTAFGPLRLLAPLEIFVDEGATLGIEDLASGRFDDQFLQATAGNTNVGFTGAAAWARFALRYGAGGDEPLLLLHDHPLTDAVEVYAISDSGVERVARQGDTLPFAARTMSYRSFVFELPRRANATVTYFVRTTGSTSTVVLPLSVWDKSAFSAHVATENYGLGLYYGVMIILALAALVFTAAARETSFASYFFYLVSFTLFLFTLNGFSYQFLWPGSPWLQQRMPTVLLAIAVIAGLVFLRRLLLTAERLPVADAIVRATIAAAGACAVYYVIFASPTVTALIIGIGIALPLLVLWIAGCCVAMGDRTARFVLAAWLVYLAGASTTGLHVLGYLPHHFITTYGLQTASILEFVMLSLALGDRLWMVKREQQSRMSEMNRELSMLNENLESIVVERTRKLEQKNLELRELAVRDSLTGLFNRSTTIELLEQLLQQSKRYHFSIAAIMLDLDHFKSINDGYGHLTGDLVIEAVADILKQSARSSDIVGRYGGEEFLIVLAHADESAAREYGERLLQRLRTVRVKGVDRPLTASAGISITGQANQVIATAEIIARADDALYESKHNGRDCLTLSEQSLVVNA